MIQKALEKPISLYKTGRRKTSTAKVRLSIGSGKIIVNNKELVQYFARPTLRMLVNEPFIATNRCGMYDVVSNVSGGGLSGQAGAIRHGISRALNELNEHDQSIHSILRKANLLTRDKRCVERKKYGRRKARAGFQFSKR